MSALDDARAADSEWSLGEVTGHEAENRLAFALRALIAEHERLTSTPTGAGPGEVENSPKRLAYEVKMMLSSVASHGPAALTTTSDPMYTARLLGRLRDALERLTAPPTDDESIEQTARRLDPAVSNAHATLFPPTADEREALIALRLAYFSKTDTDGERTAVVRDNAAAADIVLAAGFRRQGPITDAQVEAAARAMMQASHGDDAWDERDQFEDELYRRRARAALDAARDAS